MRLLRLTTDNTKALFDNNFNTDIKIEQGEQIALQSCSFSEQISVLKVDGTNNQLSFKYTGNNTLSIILEDKTGNKANGEPNVYDATNFNDLLKDITDKLNKALIVSAGKTLGISFKADIAIQTDRVRIGYRRSDHATVKSRVDRGQAELSNNLEVINTNNVFRLRRNIGSANDDVAKYYSLVPWRDGCFTFRCQIDNYSDNGSGVDDNGFVFGLSTVNPSVWKSKATMSADEKTYYIKFIRNGVKYKIKAEGQPEADTAQNITAVANAGNNLTGDYLEWSIDGSNIRATVYQRASEAGVEIYTANLPAGTDRELYPFVTVQGGAGRVQVRGAVHSINPFHNTHLDTNVENSDIADDTITVKPPSVTPGVESVNTLIMSQTVASFLGYENPSNTQNSGSVCNFDADKVFVATNSNTSFIIELMNIQINSYNADSGQRQNIIAVVPKDVEENSIIEYEPNNLYFIDVSNTFSLRNIKARILRIDGSTPLVSGKSVLTLLIKSK